MAQELPDANIIALYKKKSMIITTLTRKSHSSAHQGGRRLLLHPVSIVTRKTRQQCSQRNNHAVYNVEDQQFT